MQAIVQPDTPLRTGNPRGGIDIVIDMTDGAPLQGSPVWSTAGRQLQFVRLPPGQRLDLPPGEHYLKVIVGNLAQPPRSCLAAPFAVRSTRITGSALAAGSRGALLALMTMAADAPRILTDMRAAQFTGPHSDALGWQRFDEKFAGIIDFFDGLDCHMASGFHLIDTSGSEIVYVNPWTCGKGVDLSTHNHGHPPSDAAPAFVEVHWVLANGTGQGGMYRTDAPGAAERTRCPMQLGDEHGPFWDVGADGLPLLRDNGAVSYPWHGWQGGEDHRPGQAYDYVAAFEINPEWCEPAGR